MASQTIQLGNSFQLGNLGSQSANLVLAGPASGGPGLATFRALVPSDLPTQKVQAKFTWDGQGVALTTGHKVWFQMQQAGTISSYTLLGDQAGSIVITVKKATYANFPTFGATSVINGGTPPTLSAAQKATDSTLTNWTGIALLAGDIIECEISSVSTLTRAQLFISINGV